MSSAAAVADGSGTASESVKGEKKGGKKKLVIIAVPVLLIAIGAGLWFTGILPGMLGMNHPAAAEHEKEGAKGAPVFIELPEMVANLNVGARRTSFVKLKARIELSRPEDQAAFLAAQPRIIDLFQTYLRDMRPEELRGSAGSYRLREELIARASLAAAPARVVDVLFTELLIQ